MYDALFKAAWGSDADYRADDVDVIILRKYVYKLIDGFFMFL